MPDHFAVVNEGPKVEALVRDEAEALGRGVGVLHILVAGRVWSEELAEESDNVEGRDESERPDADPVFGEFPRDELPLGGGVESGIPVVRLQGIEGGCPGSGGRPAGGIENRILRFLVHGRAPPSSMA
jgi:hypothetical protein